MHPIISIIIPVYNTVSYLSRCINSVLMQVFQEWEIILVDDGSSDDSGKICDGYASKDRRIKVFHNTNNGASYSRFFGMQKASGEYICFVDADDSLPQDALEKLYGYCVQYNADIIVGGYTRMCDGKIIDYCGFPLEIVTGKSYLFSLLTGNWKIYGPVAKLFKRKLFSYPHPNIPKDIHVGEDLLMNVFLAAHANSVVFIPHSVYNYYQITTSATHTFKYTVDYMLLYLSELKKILQENEVRNVEVFLSHYKIIIMYNVLLDDVDDEIDYRSNNIRNILKDVQHIDKTTKERMILLLVKHRLLRIYYRRLVKNYRNGTGLLLSLKRILCK